MKKWLTTLLFAALLVTMGVASTAFAQGDTQPPTVIAVTPLPGSTNQAVATNVTATFSEAIQSSSVVFVLRDSANVVVPASVSYDSPSRTVTLHPGSEQIRAFSPRTGITVSPRCDSRFAVLAASEYISGKS